MNTMTSCSTWLKSAALACLLLPVACSPQKAVIVNDPGKLPTPPPRESARPALTEALQNAARATAEAERARESVDRAKAAAASAQAAMKDSVAEAKRLRDQKSASENELLNLYNHLVEMEKGMTLMTEDITRAQTALALEKKLSADTLARLQKAEALTIEKDAEVAELRRMLTYSENLTAKATATAQEAVNSAEKLRSQVGVEKGRATVWMRLAWGAAALFLLSIGAHVLRSYMRI